MSQKASSADTEVVKIKDADLVELHIIFTPAEKAGNSLGYSTGCKDDDGKYKPVFLKNKPLSPDALKKITAILKKEIS